MKRNFLNFSNNKCDNDTYDSHDNYDNCNNYYDNYKNRYRYKDKDKDKYKKYIKCIFSCSLACALALSQPLSSLASTNNVAQTSNAADSTAKTSEQTTNVSENTEKTTFVSSHSSSDSSTSSQKERIASEKKEETVSEKKEENTSKKEEATTAKKEEGTSSNKEEATTAKKEEEKNTSKEDDNTKKTESSKSTEETASVDTSKSTSTDESTLSEEDTSKAEEDSTSSTESTQTALTEPENYDTVEDIEIATEDPSDYDDNELLVQFKTAVNEKRVEEIANMLPKTTLKSYDDAIAVFTAKSKSIIEEDIAILSTLEEISIIQPNYKYSFSSLGDGEEVDNMEDTTAASYFPNDTFFGKQWGLYNQGSTQTAKSASLSSSNIDIDVLDAWKNFRSDNEVVVALIDTGVDYKHKDLKDHIWKNKIELEGTSGVDDDNNGYVDDIYGWDFYNDDATTCHYSSNNTASKKDNDNHGTRCAGIIAATANNNFGIAGVASNVNVKIMSLKTAGGPNSEGDTANIIKAIKYASYNGAKICNASWNCDNDDPALKLAIIESNMLFICSAGNGYGTNIDYEPSYPCSYDLNNIVGVTSVDPDGTLSYFSNYGKKSVSMAAPGSNICSTIVGKYGYDSGTSMAVPFVTGVAAMLYAYDSTLYPSRAKKLLLAGTKSLSALKNKVSTNGIINASRAVTKVQGKTYKEDTIPPTITTKLSPRKNGVYLSVSAKDTGGSCTRARRYAYGKLSAESFKNGEKGKSIAPGAKLFLTTQGYYTIFAQDNAGNAAVKVIKVKFDKTAPSLSLSYKKYGKKYKITIKASDAESGISKVRYASSKRSASYLASKGKTISSFSKSKTIVVSSKGYYSFYVKDKAGNTKVKTIKIK